MEKTKILIVDDEPSLSRLVQTMLDRTAAYDTAVENRPYRVLETARTFKPDLVLLDVDMPGQDGGDIMRAMQNDPALKDTAIIFLSSLVSKSEVGMRGREGQEHLFLSKPAEPVTLVNAIEDTLKATRPAMPAIHE